MWQSCRNKMVKNERTAIRMNYSAPGFLFLAAASGYEIYC
jgi:hypothetical protein